MISFNLPSGCEARRVYYNSIVTTRYRLGVFPGTFHPPTRSHLALGQAALDYVDGVLFVLPRTLPHKECSLAAADRLSLLLGAIRHEPRFSAVCTRAGLFIDIARELRESVPAQADLVFLCGRDAAERIVNWDYGTPDAFAGMLSEFEMLVAAREGAYWPPALLAHRIAVMPLEVDCGTASSTEVKSRMMSGHPWEHLVPDSIHDRVRDLYSESC